MRQMSSQRPHANDGPFDEGAAELFVERTPDARLLPVSPPCAPPFILTTLHDLITAEVFTGVPMFSPSFRHAISSGSAPTISYRMLLNHSSYRSSLVPPAHSTVHMVLWSGARAASGTT